MCVPPYPLQILYLLLLSGSGNVIYMHMPWTVCICSLQDTCGPVSTVAARLSAQDSSYSMAEPFVSTNSTVSMIQQAVVLLMAPWSGCCPSSRQIYSATWQMPKKQPLLQETSGERRAAKAYGWGVWILCIQAVMNPTVAACVTLLVLPSKDVPVNVA